MVAAGLAFFALFSLLPALALVGMVLVRLAGSRAVENEWNDASALLPAGTPQLLSEFLLSVPDSFAAGLGLSINLLVVFWTVQRASSGLITALNVVYDEDEKRNRLRRELVAIAIAAVGLALLFAALFVALVLPVALDLILPELRGLISIRWIALTALLLGALCLLYAYAPARSTWHWSSVLIAAGVATLLWLIASLLFTFYMNIVGGWDQYYGSITAAVILMTWMFISSYVVMLGAEVDAQIEALLRPEKANSKNKEMLDRREQAGGRGARS
jgi:membrane protein